MPNPPTATPHSDIDGVHKDERRNVDVAAERGETAADVERAKRNSPGRPRPSDLPKGRDQRTG